MTLIQTTEALASFCARQKGAPFITVDTEFMRERTYYAKLCLVQVAGPSEDVAIDPLADGIDLAPLYELFDDPGIVKVFHAARQDIEIFVGSTGRVPAPLYDTQVAAMVCGFGESASYETLATKLAGAKIDKSSRFTDWGIRPLTDKQVTYALADVTHLRVVYEKLRALTAEQRREAWVDEEMTALRQKETYIVEPEDAWKRLKLRADKPKQRAIIRALAAWREREAQRLDVPRGRVMKDEVLAEIACHPPASPADLGRMRGVSTGTAEGRQGAEILAAVKDALALPPGDCPKGEPKRIMPGSAVAVLDLLKVLLHKIADQHGVAAKMIATTSDLERLACEDEPDIKTLSGWRRPLFGETALALKRGELALAVKDGRIQTLATPKE